MTCNKLHVFKIYNLISFDLLYTCETVITIKFMTTSIIPTSSFKPLSNPYFTPLPTPLRQLPICILWLWNSLNFLDFYRNRIINMYSFLFASISILTLNFIHAIASINNSFISIAKHSIVQIYHNLSIHLLVNFWAVSWFCLLW